MVSYCAAHGVVGCFERLNGRCAPDVDVLFCATATLADG